MNKFSKLIIVLFVGSLLSISLPVTYSYFAHEEDASLVYKSKIYNLYEEHTITKLEDGSNDSKAIFKITFAPTKYTEASSEEYEIVIPSTCTFSSVVTSGTSKKVDDTHTIIKYSKDKSRNPNIVTLSCNITPNKDINLVFKVNGNINNQKFLYNKYTYKQTYQNYIANVSGKVLDNVVLKSDNLYNEFITWIEKYAEQEGYSKEIIKYVKDKYPNKDALANLNDVLLGLNITKNNDEYTISITDNFIGYAVTYYYYNSSSDTVNMYFSTKDDSSLNMALKNYLKNYVYPDNNNSVNIVYDYIYSNNHIKSVIIDGNKIEGLELKENAALSKVNIDKGIILSSAVTAKDKNKVLVAFSDYYTMLYSFNTGMKEKYPNISSDIIKQIYNRTEIKASVTKNCTEDKAGNKVTTGAKNFNDYFVHQNGSEYILINVSYDTSSGVSGNNVLFTTLKVNEGTTLTFDNNDASLTVSINAKSEADAMDTVSKLNNYLNKNITSSDIEVVTNTENNYSIKYTISK